MRGVDLSIGPSRVAKVGVVVVTAFGLVIAAAFVGLSWLAGGFIDSIAGSMDDLGATAPDDPGAAIAGTASGVTSFVRIGALACALPIALLFGYLLLRTLRARAWLDRTTVALRGAFTTRRVDLATAGVTGDAVTHTHTHGHYRYIYTIAAIAARDPRTGTTVKIPLRGQGLKRLPAAELSAIAAAIMAVRRPHEPGYESAAGIANALRDMAAGPFPV
jgi:hypothetical protein